MPLKRGITGKGETTADWQDKTQTAAENNTGITRLRKKKKNVFKKVLFFLSPRSHPAVVKSLSNPYAQHQQLNIIRCCGAFQRLARVRVPAGGETNGTNTTYHYTRTHSQSERVWGEGDNTRRALASSLVARRLRATWKCWNDLRLCFDQVHNRRELCL